MKLALCIGINDYPGTMNDLNWCVSDSAAWKQMLELQGFKVTWLTDKNATAHNILTEIYAMALVTGVEDEVVVTYSGHGTQVWDKDGDEADGYDEAICAYDRNVIDDEFRQAIMSFEETRVTFFLDSCFSGTCTRKRATSRRKARFMPSDVPSGMKPKKKFMSGMHEILLSGCADDEYSYEGMVGDSGWGMFTYYSMASYHEGMTYREFYAKIREHLPSNNFPQTPQLECDEEKKDLVMFDSVGGDVEPEPVEEESWFKRNWAWVLFIASVVFLLFVYFFVK